MRPRAPDDSIRSAQLWKFDAWSFDQKILFPAKVLISRNLARASQQVAASPTAVHAEPTTGKSVIRIRTPTSGANSPVPAQDSQASDQEGQAARRNSGGLPFGRCPATSRSWRLHRLDGVDRVLSGTLLPDDDGLARATGFPQRALDLQGHRVRAAMRTPLNDLVCTCVVRPRNGAGPVGPQPLDRRIDLDVRRHRLGRHVIVLAFDHRASNARICATRTGRPANRASGSIRQPMRRDESLRFDSSPSRMRRTIPVITDSRGRRSLP